MDSEQDCSQVRVIVADRDRKVHRPKSKFLSAIPEDILNNRDLNERIKGLPANYNFEIHKTVWRTRHCAAKKVALQMPEGLLMFAVTICDIIEEFTNAETVIMGDVTYGACCLDDYTAKAFGADLLVHYGHSCLIPINKSVCMNFLYVFVDIGIDTSHFVETALFNFPHSIRIGLVSTVQFLSSLHNAALALIEKGYSVTIPQVRPLSPGEILGCTSPLIEHVDVLIYLGDGRFHLESVMISNPHLKAYRYDPYEKRLTEEFYDHKAMIAIRKDAVTRAATANVFGIILGTLGRQGSPTVMQNLLNSVEMASKRCIVLLLSEIFPQKLALFEDSVDAWIQIACPRLSIDWGPAFKKPLLTTYEGSVAVGKASWLASMDGTAYPMDFYANKSLGPWTPNYKDDNSKYCKKKQTVVK